MSPDALVEDPALPQISEALDPGAMTARLATLDGIPPGSRVIAAEVLKHNHGKRCSLAYLLEGDVGRRARLFAKVFKSRRGAAIFLQMRRLHAAVRRPDLVLPHPLGYLPELRMLVTEYLDGYALASDLYDGRSDEAARRMARAILELHACGVGCARRWVPRKELRNTADWIAGLTERDFENRERAWALLDRLALRSDRLPRKLDLPVHRDFYADQFWDCDGRTALLDLDDVRAGDPALDLGNFLAHLRLRPLQFPATADGCRLGRDVFLSAYREAAAKRLDLGRDLERRVRFYESTTLVRLAGVYASRERWADTLPARLLDLCERTIEEERG